MSRDRVSDTIFEHFIVGPMDVNCYLLADPKTREACLIDPGAEPDRLKRSLNKKGLTLRFIINTHGHGDHIAANGCFDAPVYIHHLDKDFLTDPEKNLSEYIGFPVRSPEAKRLLSDGDEVMLGGVRLEILHTPGHTPGSISIRWEGAVFTGDALFAGSVGRTDFAYGDGALLLRSIKSKLLVLDDDVAVLPGHGESSTIGEEKRSNPFL
ncbi:MAG: MBL fold metallo-hydrolase [Candidatus Omnitrophota bacterium]